MLLKKGGSSGHISADLVEARVFCNQDTTIALACSKDPFQARSVAPLQQLVLLRQPDFTGGNRTILEGFQKPRNILAAAEQHSHRFGAQSRAKCLPFPNEKVRSTGAGDRLKCCFLNSRKVMRGQ